MFYLQIIRYLIRNKDWHCLHIISHEGSVLTLDNAYSSLTRGNPHLDSFIDAKSVFLPPCRNLYLWRCSPETRQLHSLRNRQLFIPPLLFPTRSLLILLFLGSTLSYPWCIKIRAAPTNKICPSHLPLNTRQLLICLLAGLLACFLFIRSLAQSLLWLMTFLSYDSDSAPPHCLYYILWIIPSCLMG